MKSGAEDKKKVAIAGTLGAVAAAGRRWAG